MMSSYYGTLSRSPRVQEQLLRDRLLRGRHSPDVEREIVKDYAPEIAAELRLNPDVSDNLYLATMNQLAVSYDSAPSVQVEGVEDADDLTPIIPPKLWPLCQERDLIQRGIRECFMRLDWSTDEGTDAVSYRVVSPGYVIKAEADASRPDRPVCLTEYRLRMRDGEQRETYETWDIRDPDAPIFRIEEEVDGERVDMTATYTESTDYPYRDEQGEPILPYVLYHARLQDRLFDFMSGVELVRGTLRLCVGWTAWWDAFNNASSPQRISIDLQPPAGSARTLAGSRNIDTITTSPKTILKFESTRDSAGRIDTYPPGMAPMEGVDALRAYGERLAVYAGLNPGDLQVTGQQSGIAIIVSRDGQRRAQAKAEPVNRDGDAQLLATAARLANAYGGASLPTDERAYSVQYAQLGLSQQERKVLIENVEKETALGLVSRVTMARRLNPGLDSDEEAITFLVDQQLQERALAAALAEVDEAEQDIPGAVAEVGAAREMLRSGAVDVAALDEALLSILAELGGEDDQPAIVDGEE